MGDRPKLIDTKNPKRIRKKLRVTNGTRLAQRVHVAKTWLKEEENSRYRYNVETCKDGKKVYLLRPAWLNKGFDFQINLEGFKSKSNEAPRHKDLLRDLKAKKKKSQRRYKKFRKLIDAVYECKEPDKVLKRYGKLKFQKGLPVDSVLKLLKWLFIEQDLTYWNGTGRRMFMKAIEKLD